MVIPLVSWLLLNGQVLHHCSSVDMKDYLRINFLLMNLDIGMLEKAGIKPTQFDRESLGTVGRGNHFAELQVSSLFEFGFFAYLRLDVPCWIGCTIIHQI